MRLYIERDYDAMSERAAGFVASQVILREDSVLGLPTGSTPLGLYRCLIAMHEDGRLDFSQVVTFNLDEYLGLAADHPQSYHHYMDENLLNHVNIPRENIHIPSGMTRYPKKACQEYENAIEEIGGIDLQVLGVGRNGHIGFNEPADELKARTHIARLAEETIRDNSRFFSSPDEVPKKAISMGMGTILGAKRILLVASGKAKSEVIRRLIEGPITTENPATFLKLHPRVTVILDQDAAEKLG